MEPSTVLLIISAYFLLLVGISFLTARKSDSSTFFTGNRASPWYLVAFGMVGASLSGVTFISVPGWVADSQFSYMQMVLGYLVGYAVIALILMPLYYKLNLISIYEYLDQRFGFWAYKMGSLFFLISRTVGAAFRLFLVAGVLQLVLFDAWGISFGITVLITIVLIWIYTFRGGIKTIVWTDTLQTLFMLSAVIIAIYLVATDLGLGFGELISTVKESDYSQIFVWDWRPKTNFFKQFISGAFIAIVMTGLDQDMMQKNLTCKNIGDAQKNMLWFSVTLVFVNLLFLSLGALLYIYAAREGITLPVNHFSFLAGVTFLLGIIAAAYSSADSALTALTTSFCVDFLNFKREETLQLQVKQRNTRLLVHLGFSILLYGLIMVFYNFLDGAVIVKVFEAAGYTYGPLLGMFAFGLLTKWKVRDVFIPVACILAPILSYMLYLNSEAWFNGYKVGFEVLLINGAFTFLLMMLFIKKDRPEITQDGPAVQH